MIILTGKVKYLEENLSHMDWPGIKAFGGPGSIPGLSVCYLW
jgi:hypothetical protein